MVTKARRYIEVNIGMVNCVNTPEWSDGMKREVRNITHEVEYQNPRDKTQGPRKNGCDSHSPTALLHGESECHARQRQHNKRKP